MVQACRNIFASALVSFVLVGACRTPPAAQAQVVVAPQTRLTIMAGDGQSVTLCVNLTADDPAAWDALRHADSFQTLFAQMSAHASSACRNEHTRAALPAPAPAANQAGLVIDFGDNRVQTFCLDLGDDGQATGEELLRASGLAIAIEYTGGVGGAVCKIDTVGSNFPAESCFAQCTLKPGEPCRYWSYSQLAGDGWRYSQLGASNTTVRAGDVDGWAWGEGSTASGAQPPVLTFGQVCAAGVATATPTATPIQLPVFVEIATPSATPQPSPTATPSVTSSPTAQPSIMPQPSVTPQSQQVNTPAATLAVPTAPPSTSPPLVLSATAAATSTVALAPIEVSPPTMAAAPTPAPPTVAATSAVVAASDPATSSVTPLAASIRSNGSNGWLPLVQQAMPQASSPRMGSTQLPAPITVEASANMADASATTTPARQPPANDLTRMYPYFGGMALLLIGCWAIVRRGRGTGT